MNTSGCSRGLFSDGFFDFPDDTFCYYRVTIWVAFVVVLILVRIATIVQSGRFWVALYCGRNRIRQSKRRSYCCRTRLPVIPFLMAVSGSTAILMWILASFNVANFSNGGSLALLGIYLTMHFIMANLTFVRYVHLGLRIVPLVRNMRQSRDSRGMTSGGQELTSRTIPEGDETVDVGVRREATSSADHDGVLGREMRLSSHQAPVLDEPKLSVDSTNASSALAPLTVAASGMYSSLSFAVEPLAPESAPNRPKSFVGLLDSEHRTGAATEIAGDTNDFDPPLKLLFGLQCACLTCGTVAASVLGVVLSDKDFVISLSCFLFAVSTFCFAGLHYWQLYRNINAVKRLNITHAGVVSAEDVQQAIFTLSRERFMAVLSNLLYCAICLYVGIAHVNRPWWLFYLIECTIVIHESLLLIIHYRKQQVKTRKMNERRRREMLSEAKGIRQKVQAIVSVNAYGGAKSSSVGGGRSSNETAAEDVPSYEQAWEEGFRWRRWSVGYERKERLAFIREYRQWKQEQQQPQVIIVPSMAGE